MTRKAAWAISTKQSWLWYLTRSRNVTLSHSQGLSHLARSVKQVASAAIKKHQITIEADMKRYEIQLKYRQEEARCDRKHELKLQKSKQKSLRQRLLHLLQAIIHLGLQFRICRDK